LFTELQSNGSQWFLAILEALMPDGCSLGHFLRYIAEPGHYECHRKGDKEDNVRVLVLQHWARGSRVDYYPGSHVVDLPVKEGVRSLLETTKAALDEAGCFAQEEVFPDGGL
jgi:hypothetical protein